MHGPVEQTDQGQHRRAGRRRGRQAMPSPAVLALPVAALLAGVVAGAALLPPSLTGPGAAAERPESAVAALAPGAGGGAPGAGTATAEPPAPATSAPPATRSPRPGASAAPKPKPATRKPTTRPAPRRTAVAAGLTGQENEVVRLVNVERGKAGCGAVRPDTKLRTAIRLHVKELGTHGNLYISHVSDDGRDFVQRAKEQGYDAPGGENVARGQRDAADVMTSWMNSEGHRANILNCAFEAIGAGAVKGVDGTIVWGQLFGRS
ncbi:CAP domain-containing protein [Actinoplanes sp. NPDC049316]|uniref:CAP domain-containing protein n=1 Tax=Actinoplanes sp. NPDC049316 TaxID=3154727 RepID=UPI00343F9E6D